MSRVSLIVTLARGETALAGSCAAACRALEAAGHEVEVIVALGPAMAAPDDGDDPSCPDWRWVVAPTRGQVAAAVEGLYQASGEILLIVDPAAGYDPADVVAVAATLASGQGEVAIASRWAHGRLGAWRAGWWAAPTRCPA